MGLQDYLFGGTHKAQNTQLSLQTGGQEQALMQLLQGLMGQGGGMGGPMGAGMGRMQNLLMGGPEAYKEFEGPAMQQFNQQIMPEIAERFAGMGAGSQGSSAFGQQMGGAASGLAQQLAAMRAQLQEGQMGRLQQMLQLGLGTKGFENMYTPEKKDYGFVGMALPALAQGAGMAMGAGLPSAIGKLPGAIGGLWNSMTRSGGSGLNPGEMFSPRYGYQSGG